MVGLLLVDGDRNFRRTIEIALRLDGVEVATVGSAAAAEQLLACCAFELVVVDSLLADADAVLLRAAGRGARVIATGPHRELLERAARVHGVATLEKPFAPSALLATAQRAEAT